MSSVWLLCRATALLPGHAVIKDHRLTLIHRQWSQGAMVTVTFSGCVPFIASLLDLMKGDLYTIQSLDILTN